MAEQHGAGQLERRALTIGAIASLFMAAAGWVTYFLTGSEAMLFDGNFSFIAAGAGFVSVYISRIKHKRTSTMPFGQFQYETLFVLLKGLVLAGVILAALTQNSINLVQYFRGATAETIVFGPIIYYVILMVVISVSLAAYFRKTYRASGSASPMLRLEAKAALLDGALSAALGIALLLISIIPTGSPIEFMLYVGDSVVVILVSLYFLKMPFIEIREAILVIAGAVLSNKQELDDIMQVIRGEIVDGFSLIGSYVNSTGSSYVGLVYLKPLTSQVNVSDIDNMRTRLGEALMEKYPFTDLELIVTQDEEWENRKFLTR